MTVSVIICAYNRNASLVPAVASAIHQTLPPHEIIVVDDGSSPEVRLPDYPNLKLIRHKTNRGASAARNTGIQHASGRYVAFLDSDDIWRPEKLERQVESLCGAGEDVCGIFSSYQYHRPEQALRGGIIETPQVDDWLDYFCRGLRSGPGSTLMVKRHVFEDIGGFDERFRRLEDWDWLLRAAKKFQFQSISDVLADVVFSGSPASDVHLEALGCVAARHIGDMPRARYRRTLEAAIAVEAAAALVHEGRFNQAARKLIASLIAPRIVVSELLRTIQLMRSQTNDQATRTSFDRIVDTASTSEWARSAQMMVFAQS